MTGFMIGGDELLLFGHYVLAGRSHENFVASVFEVTHSNDGLISPRGPQCCLVDEIADIGAGHAHSAAGEPFEINIIGDWDAARMNFKQLAPARECRAVDRDMTIEPARPEQGGIEY